MKFLWNGKDFHTDDDNDDKDDDDENNNTPWHDGQFMNV